jgi:hypothetical protein
MLAEVLEEEDGVVDAQPFRIRTATCTEGAVGSHTLMDDRQPPFPGVSVLNDLITCAVGLVTLRVRYALPHNVGRQFSGQDALPITCLVEEASKLGSGDSAPARL